MLVIGVEITMMVLAGLINGTDGDHHDGISCVDQWYGEWSS